MEERPEKASSPGKAPCAPAVLLSPLAIVVAGFSIAALK
jgi:hypothetical protein